MPKRKQPDDDEDSILSRGNSFTEESIKNEPSKKDTLPKGGLLNEVPIENEYEHLDDENDDDLDEDGVAKTTKIGKDDYEEIMRAQEPATIAQDGDIKFTPFNLTEELEEGEFDKSGNFIFRKKINDEEQEGGDDTWAESVDWAEVERKEKERKEQQRVEDILMQESKSPTKVRDKLTCYRDMLRIMRAEETVQKTIRRLGNNIPRRRPFNRNARKMEQANSSNSSSNDTQTIEEIKKKLDLMIELADHRLSEGDMDIYEMSYEDLEEAINR